jgi:hypothetical protein
LAIVKSRLNMAVLKDRGRKGGHSNPTGFRWHMKGHHVADKWCS